jgi:hypothetical protein
MSQIEIKIDGRVFKVGEEKIWNGEKVVVKGFTDSGNILAYMVDRRDNGYFLPSKLTDIPPKRTVPMTYEDLRDLVAREKGGVEFETKNGNRVLNPDIVVISTGHATIWSMTLDLFRCYRLYSENWAVEHPFTKEVEG